MQDVGSPVVVSTYVPRQRGWAPDLPLLPALARGLWLPWTHYGVVLVLGTSFADASIGVVF